MRLIDIHHIALKTVDLEATNAFYCGLLGMEMVDRPPFDFPGSWLNIENTMIHVMAGHAARDASGQFNAGSGAIDHIAMAAQGFDEMKARLDLKNVEWRQLAQHEAKLWQLFFFDPNGILIELNFPIAGEPEGSIGPDGSKPYVPGRFRPSFIAGDR